MIPNRAARFPGFCSAVTVEESIFESSSLSEIQHIADVVESNIDELGGEAVELHEGVLSIEFSQGTFVINKHGASKQIWYSSPVSQPAYFDALTDMGRRWWSIRLQTSLRQKLEKDIRTITGKDLDLKSN